MSSPKILCLLVLLVGVVPRAFADDWSKWRTYENEFFRIHSDAKESKVLELFEELETFRLLVRQAIKVKIPKDAPKTEVLLFRRSKDFRKVSWHRNLAGFVTSVDGKPIIVMPESKRGLTAQVVIKHEYVHIAQAYDSKSYPRWWNEGLAEVLSTVEYRKELAIVGKPNPKRWRYLSREINYDEIVADDYDNLKTTMGADAYAQYWLLAIYSLVHEEGVYLDELGDHIRRYRESGNSLESFVAAYGRTPQAFAKEAMKNMTSRTYSYKPLFYLLDFDERDLVPDRLDIDLEAVSRYQNVLLNRKAEEMKK